MINADLIRNSEGLATCSGLLHLRCAECGLLHDASVINTVCANINCRSVLFAEYNLPAGLPKSILANRPATMWRYKEFLPVTDIKNIVTLGEGFTPILPAA